MKGYLFRMNASGRPSRDEVAVFYHGYIDRCEGDDLFQALDRATLAMKDVVGHIPPDAADHRYAVGKWSIKEVIQHVIDAERVFAYRALCFARNDATTLPAFDEDSYAPASQAGRRALPDLMDEHDAVRRSTILLFRSFTPEMLLRDGKAGTGRMTVRGTGWTIAGHALHHVHVIGDRYLHTPQV